MRFSCQSLDLCFFCRLFPRSDWSLAFLLRTLIDFFRVEATIANCFLVCRFFWRWFSAFFLLPNVADILADKRDEKPPPPFS